jgi:hypothetical protein
MVSTRQANLNNSLHANILGTITGFCVAVTVAVAASYTAASLTPEIGAGVVPCALVARQRPALRVCMWACPIVLITAQDSVSTVVVAFERGSEVILGAFVGGAFRRAAEFVVAA